MTSVTEAAKVPLVTSERIYDRIRWDPAFNADDFVIVYEDRLKETGWEEKPIRDFRTRGVYGCPWHRVQQFKRHGEVVWDRTTRVDRITSGECAAVTPV